MKREIEQTNVKGVYIRVNHPSEWIFVCYPDEKKTLNFTLSIWDCDLFRINFINKYCDIPHGDSNVDEINGYECLYYPFKEILTISHTKPDYNNNIFGVSLIDNKK